MLATKKIRNDSEFCLRWNHRVSLVVVARGSWRFWLNVIDVSIFLEYDPACFFLGSSTVQCAASTLSRTQ